jgi:hypothetical protein
MLRTQTRTRFIVPSNAIEKIALDGKPGPERTGSSAITYYCEYMVYILIPESRTTLRRPGCTRVYRGVAAPTSYLESEFRD